MSSRLWMLQVVVACDAVHGEASADLILSHLI